MHLRALREEEVESMRLMQSTQSALNTDADLLSQEEFDLIAQKMSALASAVQAHDLDAMKALQKELAQATETFAERRMDRAIQQALSGKSLDEIEEGSKDNA